MESPRTPGPKQDDAGFTGSIPEMYDRHLGPLLFAPYAQDLARRTASVSPERVLEVAAGTGIVTREIARRCPAAQVVATDLNEAMISYAGAHVEAPSIAWRAADAQALPFPAGAFDAVACQFGVMFFPDRAQAFAEANRVLRAGGTYVFTVWDGLEHNDAGRVVHDAVASAFPDDPPSFLARVPYAGRDVREYERELRAAAFQSVTLEAVELRGRGTARDAAIGFCQGSPLRNEIESRAPERLQEITERAAAAAVRAFGEGNIDAAMRAYVFTARA